MKFKSLTNWLKVKMNTQPPLGKSLPHNPYKYGIDLLIYSQFQHSQMTLGFGSFQIIALIFLVVTMSYKVQSDHLGNVGQHGKKICSSCNYFQGSWVVDNHYPLYDAARCPFTKKDFNRQKNGRPADMEYLKYIWKPNSCLIPR